MDGAEIGHIDDFLLNRCLSIDLEVDPGQAKIFAFAAVRRQGQEKVVFRRGNQEAALDHSRDSPQGPTSYLVTTLSDLISLTSQR